GGSIDELVTARNELDAQLMEFKDQSTAALVNLLNDRTELEQRKKQLQAELAEVEEDLQEVNERIEEETEAIQAQEAHYAHAINSIEAQIQSLDPNSAEIVAGRL